MNDTDLIVMIAALHIVALAAGALLVLALALTNDERPTDPDTGPTDGEEPRPPPATPPIGPPLPDAVQAPVRLRHPGRLVARMPVRQRHRPAPDLPTRRTSVCAREYRG
jgi:hypothetical protein